VNAVSLGIIVTPWWDRMPERARNAYFAQTAASVPVGRVGQLEDVAQTILLLIQNSFVLGRLLTVWGGTS